MQKGGGNYYKQKNGPESNDVETYFKQVPSLKAKFRRYSCGKKVSETTKTAL